MDTDSDPTGPPAPPASARELELETKLNKRTLWMGLFAFLAVTEAIIMVEVLRQAN